MLYKGLGDDCILFVTFYLVGGWFVCVYVEAAGTSMRCGIDAVLIGGIFGEGSIKSTGTDLRSQLSR